MKHPSTILRISTLIPLAAALGILLATPASPYEFNKGEIRLSLDTTISWGMSWRTEDRDLRLVGLANGGSAFSVNGDDGNLNYDQDLWSNTPKITSELEINYRGFGTFVRFRGFYDYESEDGERERTPLSSAALDRVGTRADFLDAFLWFRFDLGNKPAEIRIGDQVLSWGESTFIQNSINTVNPIDVSALRVPGAELREALLPEGMLTGRFTTSENTSFELFYLFDWNDTEIDPPGSYFASNDFAGDGGRHVFLGFGDSGDLVTFPGTDRPFLGVPRDQDLLPSDSGQYGAAFRWFLPKANSMELGFYFINYHSRLPTINGRTGTPAGAVAAQGVGTAGATALGNLAAGAPRTVAIGAGINAGVGLGLTPTEAGIVSTAAVDTALAGGDGAAVVSAFATDAYAKTAGYYLEFPEDIKLLGLSLNSEIGKTGIAIQGEISHRLDAPLQVDDVELLFAALGPINPGLAAFNQVGNFTGQWNTGIQGYKELDVSQFQATFSKLFGPTFGADEAVLLWEGAVTYVHDMPDKDVLRFEGPGTYVSGNPFLGPSAHTGKPIEGPEHFADATSWGYRLVGRLDFYNVFAAINLSPRFSWQHDVEGISPAPGGNFIEGRNALTLGLAGTYQNTWQADVSYTFYSGAGRYNLINDRDFFALNLKYSF